jgi:hypothetical protein
MFASQCERASLHSFSSNSRSLRSVTQKSLTYEQYHHRNVSSSYRIHTIIYKGFNLPLFLCISNDESSISMTRTNRMKRIWFSIETTITMKRCTRWAFVTCTEMSAVCIQIEDTVNHFVCDAQVPNSNGHVCWCRIFRVMQIKNQFEFYSSRLSSYGV